MATVVGLATTALAQEIMPRDYVAAADDLAALEQSETLITTCPADLYQTQMTLSYRLFGRSAFEERADCAADFTTCVASCVNDSDPRSCFHAAVLLERSGQTDLRLSARIAHALACAAGEAAGCTNRGGGIRNVPIESDPLSLATGLDQSACLFETFEASCTAGDSWGCAMSAQTYAYGEGVDADPTRAFDLYQKACSFAQGRDFPSCQFALRGIEALGDL